MNYLYSVPTDYSSERGLQVHLLWKSHQKPLWQNFWITEICEKIKQHTVLKRYLYRYPMIY